MGAAWLIVPAVIFLASRPKEAAPAQPSEPEVIAGVSIDINAIAQRLRERAFGLGGGDKRVQLQAPSPTGSSGRTFQRETLL